MDRVTGAVRDRYRIVRELGEGGMATVYLAEDLRHGRMVALKVLKPELAAVVGAERFLAEIRTTASLQHPHVLPLYESGEADGFVFYTMPSVEGESLRDRLEREPQLPIDEALRLTTGIAEALAYAHRQGVIHRDIKPANILLFDGKPVVADFGIALAMSAGGMDRLTETGLSVGTPYYMSPEQATGEATIGPAADIYALGCVLYEMLVGEPPFTGGTPQAVLARIITGGPPSARAQRETIPPHVDAAIAKALAKVPADRHHSAEDFAAALVEPPADADAPAAGPAARGIPSAVASGGRPVAVAALALLVVLASYLGGRNFLDDAPASSASGAPAAVRSIAVLPFDNLMADDREQYFVDGMTEQLITELAKVGGLTVISRASVMRYRDSGEPIPSIAEQLGVGAIVTGSALKVGDRVRITAQLVDGATGNSWWAESYDRAIDDVLAIHSEVARSIVSGVSVVLTPEDERRLARSPSVNPAAYEAYLQGRFWWNRRTDEGFLNAIASFERAIELDSTYAPAYAGLADAHGLRAYYGSVPPRMGYGEAIEAARAALRLDDGLAEAHASLGGALLFYEWDWEGAEREFQRAIELNPSYATAHHWYWVVLAILGRWDEAAQRIARAKEIDPFSVIINRDVAKHAYFRRDFDAAAEQLTRTLDLDSNFHLAHWYVGRILEQRGLYRRAIESYERSVALSARSPIQLAALGHARAGAGDRAGAEEILAELQAMSLTRHVDAFGIAEIYVRLGDLDRAFEWFDEAYQERSVYMIYLGVDPRYDDLRGDPRFVELLRRMRLTG